MAVTVTLSAPRWYVTDTPNISPSSGTAASFHNDCANEDTT